MKSLHWPLVAVLCALSSGCLEYILVMGNGQQKGAANRKVIGEAVGDAKEKKDCPRWIAGLNAVRQKLPVKDPIHNDTTWYGSEVRDAYGDCLFWGLLDQQRVPGTEREKLSRLIERIDLVQSLPLQELKIEDRTNTNPPIPGKDALPALRTELARRLAEFDRRAAEQLARQTKRIDAGTLAESKGWPVAALAAWLSVEPVDAAMKARRDDAVKRLTPLARANVAVAVAVLPAPVDAAPAAVLAQLRNEPALATRPTLRLVDTADVATVQAHVSVGAFSRETTKERVNFEHSYVSGSKEVPNPRLATLQKDIAYHDKEAAYWRGKVSSIRCTGSGPCKSRISAQDNVRREEEHAARDRRELAGEKPTTRQNVTAVYPYSGDKTVFNATAPLVLTLTSKLAPAPSKVTGAAKVQRTAVVYAGNASVGLAGRSDPTPTPAELDTALSTECARVLADAVLNAPMLAAAEFDAQASAAKEPLEKLHYALVRSLRSGQGADVESAYALETELLGAKLDAAVVLRALSTATSQPSAGVGSR